MPSPAAAEQQLLRPVSKWDLNYGDTDCAVIRDYGTAEKPVSFSIRPSPNGETYEMLIGRRTIPPETAQELQGTVDFGGGPISAWVLHYGATSKKLDIYQFRIAAADMARARLAKAVILRMRDAPDFAFAL